MLLWPKWSTPAPRLPLPRCVDTLVRNACAGPLHELASQEALDATASSLRELSSKHDELQRDVSSRNPNQLYRYVAQASQDLEAAAARIREARVERDQAFSEVAALKVGDTVVGLGRP